MKGFYLAPLVAKGQPIQPRAIFMGLRVVDDMSSCSNKAGCFFGEMLTKVSEAKTDK
jgi:hypothetical protein